jgi:ABC-type multidrug transport system fused ATPase/permease subunit
MFFHAAGRSEQQDAPGSTPTPESGAARPIVQARALDFRYQDRAPAILQDCHLTIVPGDRILLEGPSGEGKSTLAALLAGLRAVQGGELRLEGRDARSLDGESWRKIVVAAPQFHENHVLAESFAFNLLMGRGWPPRHEDLQQAEAICRELGLGALLDRMPAGMLQTVGETGWQLSHGERSRLYIARALLQATELVILDESFASLDPESLLQALRTVVRRARALLIIAHP